MAKKSIPPTKLIGLSIYVSCLAVISILISSSLSTSSLPSTIPTVKAYDPPDSTQNTSLLTTAQRSPIATVNNLIDISNLQVGDQVGNLILRTLAPADPSYSRTPQLDNFSITFQGKIAIDGRYTTCFKPSNSSLLPRFSNNQLSPPGSICFDNPKTITKHQTQLTSGRPLTVTLDNFTITRLKNHTSATATLESVTPTKE